MNADFMPRYREWLCRAVDDPDLIPELSKMNEAEKEDAFYKDLSFGTGGLRGIIGAGTNRMNVYTVARASQGVANYVAQHFDENERAIAISYDSRIKSEYFAKRAAEVFAASGIKVWMYHQLMPTPCLSYAVRSLHCSAGIMMTASHNRSKYNGYKVYGSDGCQITTEAADEILREINQLSYFDVNRALSFHDGQNGGMISWIPEEVYTSFTEEVKKQSLLGDEKVSKDISIVYSPLNGTGLKPVLRVLKESGYTDIHVVKEQENPDGMFPTCPYPNPEIPEAMSLGIKYAEKYHADLLLATDPDCDRVGIAVRNEQGEYQLLTGNETGLLLLDYICSRRIAIGRMPSNPVFIKTIVTMDLAEQIAASYHVTTINVLTGFKYIGEQIGLMEKKGCASSYILGFEESYGYLTGSYVRDKDAVDGSFMICEMTAYYHSKGISLLKKLQELYQTYGFCLNTLHSFEFEGASGQEKMKLVMKEFRTDTQVFGDCRVDEILDYSKGLDHLPKADVLKFLLEDRCSVVIRPSGTEPKLKVYLSVSAESRAAAVDEENKIYSSLKEYIIRKTAKNQ